MTTGQKYNTKEADQHQKHVEENEHWLNQTSTSNRHTALPEDESEDQQQKAGPENTPKPPPIDIADIKNISPLIQLLEQNSNMKLKLSHKIPKTSESCRTIIKALAETRTEFNTHK
jgi:hypothetical protein